MEKEVLIINGPNLNLTGNREEEIYGYKSFNDYYKEELIAEAKILHIALEYYQSNHEGEIIDKIHSVMDIKDMIIINPGAFTHYSYAIHDAIKAVKFPVVEVHISNIFAREEWRKKSVISPAVTGVISGFGLKSYLLALKYFAE